MVGEIAAGLDLRRHLGQLVPDRLEAADRPAEGLALLHVLERELDHGLHAAHRAEAGRAATYNALRLFADGHDAIKEVTIAKLKTQRDAFDQADDALQIFGGAGYMKEYGIERAARDLRLGPIGGGTDEIMKEILAKQLGL